MEGGYRVVMDRLGFWKTGGMVYKLRRRGLPIEWDPFRGF